MLTGLHNYYQKHRVTVFWLAVALLLFTRVGYIAVAGNFDKSTFTDAVGYNEYAKTIVTNPAWLTSTDYLASFREPVYPIFVGIVYYIFGLENFWAVYLLQAVLSAFMLVLIFKTTLLLCKNQTVAYLAMLWAGVYIFFLRYVGELLRETIVYLLVVWLVYLLVRIFTRKQAGFKQFIAPALVYTLLIHTDGRYLGYAPFIALTFLLVQRRFWLALKQSLQLGLIVVICTIPWTIRNYIAYGDIIVVSYYTLNLTGSEVSARGELFDTSEITEVGTSLHFINYNHNYPGQAERDSVKAGYNPRKRTARELKAIKNDETAGTTLLSRKWYFFKRMWRPVNPGGYYIPFPMAQFDEGYSFGHNAISLVQYGLLIPFMLIAFVSALKKRNYLIWALFIPIIAQMFIHILTFGIERYRHPVDSFIIILGCWGLAISAQKLFIKKQVNAS